MSQVTEHHLQAPELPSHEHGRKQIFRGCPKASILFELTQDILPLHLTHVASFAPQ